MIGMTRSALQLLEAADDAFLESLDQIGKAKQLEPIAAAWKVDPRPWARQQKFLYFERPLNAPGHQTVVKQLFKQAEDDDDRELLAVCLVAFDRLVRYTPKRRMRYDWDTQTLDRKSVV